MFAKTLLVVLVLVGVCLWSVTTRASTYTWSGTTGVSGNWGAAADWGGANFPGNNGNSSGDTATFNFGTVANPIINMDAAYGVSAVSMTGNGTLTLNGPSSNQLSISAPSGITVGSGQTLNGSGTLNAPVALWGGTLSGTLSTGAVNSVGGSLTPGSFTSMTFGTLAINGGLTMDSGTSLNFLLGGNATPGTTYDQITTTGSLDMAGTINLWGANYNLAAEQQYTLMTCAGGSTPTGNLTWGYSTGTSGLYNCTLSYSAGQVNLNLLALSTARTFTWAPGSDSNWGTAGNWTGGGPVMGAQSQDIAAITLGTNPVVVNMEASHSIPKLTIGGTGTLTVNGSGVLSVPNGISLNNNQTMNGTGTVVVPNSVNSLTINTGAVISGSLSIQGIIYLYGNVTGSHVIGSPSNGNIFCITGGGVFDGTNTIYASSVVIGQYGGPATLQGTNTIYTPIVKVYNSSASGSSLTLSGVNYVYGLTGGIWTQDPANSNPAVGGNISGSGELDGNLYDYFGNYNASYLITGNVWVGSTGTAGRITNPTSNFAGTSQINGSVYLGGKSGTTANNAAKNTFTGGNTIGQDLTVSNVAPTSYTTTTISPHNGTSGTGTLTVGHNMTLDANTVLNFNLGVPGALGANSDYISVGNNLSLSGTLNANAVPGYIGGNTYTLITYGGTESGTLTIGTMPLIALYTYSLTYTGGNVNLTSVKSGSAITWNSNVTSGSWTAQGSWTGGVAPTGSNGVFLSGAGSYAVNIDSASAVNAIGVTDNGVWSVSGNAITLGVGGLTYLSTAASTISAPLGGTGGVTVYNGALTLGAGTHGYSGATAIGTNGTLTVNGTVSGTSSVTINSSGTLNGSGSISGSMALLPGGTLSGSVTVGGNITVTGGTITANAPVITGSPTINGSLALASNILNVNGAPIGSGLWSLSTGTINNTGSIGNPITLNGAATLTGTSGVYGGTVTLNSSGTAYFTGSNLQFNGPLVATGSNMLNVTGTSIAGSGTWTIPASTTVYVSGTGSIGNAISLTGGTLQGSGSGTYAGLVTATSGTITSGRFTGGLTTSGGAIIAPYPTGTIGTIGTIPVVGAVSTTGTTFNFDLGSANDSDHLAVTGTATLAGTLNTNLYYPCLPAGVHTYTVCTTTVGSPNISGLTWSTPNSNAYMTNTGLVSSGGALTITYTRAANIPFTYTGGGNWDTPADWNVGSLIVPASGDTATFDLSANPTLSLFGNGGEMVGSLVLQNSGVLTLNNWNVVLSGTTTIGTGQTITGTTELHIGSGGVLTGAGTVDNQSGYAVTIASGGTLSGTLAVTGNVNVGSGTGKALTPATAGTTGTIAIGGTLTMDANTTFNYDLGTVSDLITITGTGSTLAGSVNVAAQPGFASSIGANAYALMTYNGSAPATSLTLGTVPTNARLSYGPITAGGGIVGFTVTRTNGAFTWTGSGGNTDWNRIGNWNMAGITPVPGDSVVFPLASQTLDLVAPHSVTAATLSGGTLTLNGTNSSNALILTDAGGVAVGTGQTLNGNGYIATGAGGIALSGTGKLCGTLHVTGNVSATGGTISGTPTIGGNLTVTLGNEVTITPHGDAIGSVGTLTVGGNATLDSTTILNFNLGPPGTIGGGISDFIDITGNLSLDGTLNVNALTGFGIGTYRLINYTGTLTGNLAQGAMPSGFGYAYIIDTSTLHQVNLNVVMPYLPGDTNRDGKLNSLDIDAIYHNFNAAANSQWKVTTDGLVVGQQDVTYELRKYFLTNYGDANLDNATDFPDFQTLLDHWQASGSTIGWAQGDFNGDYSVDFLDFQKLLDYWNPGGWHYAPMATPEPASLSLLVLGGLALLRRKK